MNTATRHRNDFGPIFRPAAALLLTLTTALSAALPLYDPSGQVRFSTPPQAEARRQELIRFIWADGLPTHRLPAVTANVGAAVFAGDLAGLSNAPAASVDRLDAVVEPYNFHATLYLIHPRATNANNRRLVIYHSGHRQQLTEWAGGVRNVLACDCDYEGSDIGIRLKSNASRGGVVENIYCRNITLRDIRGDAIRIESNYGAWLASKDGTNYPVFRNLRLQDVVCEGAQAAASIRGVPQQPVRGLTLENVSIRARAGMRFEWVRGLKLDRVKCVPSAGEPFSFQNCEDAVREPDR